MRVRPAIALLGVMVAATGCITRPAYEERPQPPPPAPEPASRPPSTQPAGVPPAPSLPAPTTLPPARPPAVQALLDGARADLAAGNPVSASARLERALRLSPSDGWLWHELARVRLAEGDYAQAQVMAQRARALAGTDDRLREHSSHLLSALP
jgi:cytochrome c-type biogenesis protein CcmH/NrfG